jgi:alpha-glucosidase
LPLSEDHREVNAERQLGDRASILTLYRRLLAYRKASTALRCGTYQAIEGAPQDCFVYLRQAGDQRVLIVLNFSDRDQRLALPGLGACLIAVSTVSDRTGAVSAQNLIVRGNEGILIEVDGPGTRR